MKSEVKQELIINAAAKVHEAWCQGELKAFYSRLAEGLKKGLSASEALAAACNKNGKQRNVLETNTTLLDKHNNAVVEALETFDGFMALVEKDIIKVKRFTGRTLTEEEQKKAGPANYNADTKEENILRPFKELSAASQKENLEAAKGAVEVYEDYAKRGATLDNLSSKEARTDIGTLIHADWMRRNPRTEANKHLFTEYENLDEWVKQQDLDVFEAVIAEVKKDKNKYAVKKEEGLMKLYPLAQEAAALDEKIPERGFEKWREYTADRF